jgi:hypothetical protein
MRFAMMHTNNLRLTMLGLMTLGLLAAGCPRDEDRATAPDAAAASPPSAAAKDADAACPPARLSDFCDSAAACPMTTAAARDAFCTDLDQSVRVAANSCGGASVTRPAGSGTTQYDFDSDGKLIGAGHASADSPAGCAEDTERYGQTCSLVAEPAGLCGCPAIACIDGLHIKLDLPKLDGWQGVRVEICLNDTCLTDTIDREPTLFAGGTGVFSGMLAAGLNATLTAWHSEPDSPWLMVNIDTQDATQLHDGDRYRFTLTRPDGSRAIAFEHTVEHYGANIIGQPCTMTCLLKDLDLRGQNDADAGQP